MVGRNDRRQYPSAPIAAKGKNQYYKTEHSPRVTEVLVIENMGLKHVSIVLKNMFYEKKSLCE